MQIYIFNILMVDVIHTNIDAKQACGGGRGRKNNEKEDNGRKQSE